MNKDNEFLKFFELANNQNIITFFSTDKNTIVANLELKRNNTDISEFCKNYLINEEIYLKVIEKPNNFSYTYLYSLYNRFNGHHGEFYKKIIEYQPVIYKKSMSIYKSMSEEMIKIISRVKGESYISDFKLGQMISEDYEIFGAMEFGDRYYNKNKHDYDKPNEKIEIDIDDYLRVYVKCLNIIREKSSSTIEI